LKVWRKLEPKIREMRDGNGPSDYMKNFKQLKTKAEEYAKRKLKRKNMQRDIIWEIWKNSRNRGISGSISTTR